MRKNSIVCFGNARFPDDTTTRHIYGRFAIGLEIDPNTGTILRVSSTYTTDLARDFVENILLGYDLNKGIEEVLRKIEDQMFCSSKRALAAAIRDVYAQYLEYLNKRRRQRQKIKPCHCLQTGVNLQASR